MMRYKRRWFGENLIPVLTALSALCGSLQGCGGFQPEDRDQQLQQQQQPTIVLITIDTLRADHLGCYGYPRATAPFLDYLASRGTVFEDAIAASASTSPSHASILTGLYPSEHGIRTNGERLRSGVSTAADRLKANGYFSLAFVSSRGQFHSSGMESGFDIFRDPQDFRGDGRTKLQGNQTVEMALAELTTISDERPLFIWLHLFDPHTPYNPPEAMQSNSREEAMSHVDFLRSEHGTSLEFFENDPEKLLAVIDAYDGEIRAVDSAIETFHSSLRDHSPEREWIWIVTSDHGEGLGSHDWLLHGKNLYQEQIHVPLIVMSSADKVPSRRLRGIVEHIDLFRTILDLAGVDLEFQSETAAVSLASALRGESFEGKAFAVSERRSFVAKAHEDSVQRLKAGKIKIPALLPMDGVDRAFEKFFDELMLDQLLKNFEDGEAVAVQTLNHKIIYRTELDDETIDLTQDPLEKRDLGAEGIPDVSRYQSIAVRHFHEMATVAQTQEKEIAPETQKLLEALGYLH